MEKKLQRKAIIRYKICAKEKIIGVFGFDLTPFLYFTKLFPSIHFEVTLFFVKQSKTNSHQHYLLVAAPAVEMHCTCKLRSRSQHKLFNKITADKLPNVFREMMLCSNTKLLLLLEICCIFTIGFTPRLNAFGLLQAHWKSI